MIKLTVEDFGPIRSAKNVEIRPLTVFVGPNNCGKSYLAMLVHALCRTPEGLFLGPLRWPRPHFPPHSARVFEGGYTGCRPNWKSRGQAPSGRALRLPQLESSTRYAAYARELFVVGQKLGAGNQSGRRDDCVGQLQAMLPA